MKKIIYSGNEEGLFVFGAFLSYMNKHGKYASNGFASHVRTEPIRSLHLFQSWHDGNIIIDYLLGRNVESVTVIATGRKEDIGEFERLLMQKHEEMISMVKV